MLTQINRGRRTAQVQTCAYQYVPILTVYDKLQEENTWSFPYSYLCDHGRFNLIPMGICVGRAMHWCFPLAPKPLEPMLRGASIQKS